MLHTGLELVTVAFVLLAQVVVTVAPTKKPVVFLNSIVCRDVVAGRAVVTESEAQVRQDQSPLLVQPEQFAVVAERNECAAVL